MDETFEDLFPIEKLNARRLLLRKFWKKELRTVWSSYSHNHQYRQLDNHEEMVSEAAANILECAAMPGTNITRFTIDFGTTTTASYWGGNRIKSSSGNSWIEPVIYKPGDVPEMKHAVPDSGDILLGRKLFDEVLNRLNTGNLPASTYDLQGPLNTLSLVWEQKNMMVSMYESPGSVHAALEKVTDLLIKNIESIYKKIPGIEAPLWPFIWLPPDIGIGITEDYMPLLSPGLYKEFGLPYVKRLSDKFKGLFIHCCGQFSHQIDNLHNSGINILGMEFVYPKIDIEKLFNTFGDKCAFVPNIMDNFIEDFGSFTNYIQYIEKLRKPETRLWYILRPDLPDFDEQVRLMEVIDEV